MLDTSDIDKQLQFYKQIFDSVQQAVVVTDLETRIIFWNTYAQKLYGYTSAEAMGKTVWELIAPVECDEDDLNIFRQLQSGDFSVKEYYVRNKDGNKFLVRVNISPLLDNNSQTIALISFSEDITERKDKERLLIQSEEKYRSLFETAEDAIFLANASTGILADVNKFGEKLIGFTRDELIGQHYTFLHPREDNLLYINNFEKSKVSKGEVFTNMYFQHKDGSLIPIEGKSGGIVTLHGVDYHFAIFRDVSERQEYENKLIAAKEEAENNNRINEARLQLIQFAENHTTDEILEETLNIAEQISQSKIGFFHFVHTDQNSLILQSWSTQTKKAYCMAEGRGLHYPIDKAGVWVDCVYARKPVIHNNYSALAHKKGLPEGHAPLVRELVVPIIYDNVIKAILGIGNKDSDYNQTDVENISLLAYFAWEIVEKNRIKEALILAKETAEEGHAKIESIIENTQDSIWAVNTEFRLTYANKVFRNAFLQSFNVELNVGDFIFDKLPVFLHDRWRNYYNRVFGGEYFDVEEVIEVDEENKIYTQVSFHPIKKQDKIIGATFYGRNITERKLQEKELIIAKERAEKSELKLQLANMDLKLAQEIALIGNWSLDPEIGIPVWSEEVYRIYERNPEMPPPHLNDYRKMYEPEQFEIFMQAVSNAINNGVGYNIELKFISSSNETKWVRAICLPDLTSKTTKGYKLRGTIQDITKQKLVELELKAAKEKAEESDRLKTSFMQNMSHEVRTPLNAINGFTHLIAMSNNSEPRLKHFADIITRSSNKLVEIITDVIEISKIHTQQIKLKPTDSFCNKLINNEIKENFIQIAKEKNLTLIFEQNCICGDFPVTLDVEKFVSIVNHLIDNAIKFTYTGEVKYSCRLHNRNLEIVVSDTGIGISPEMKKIIFEPFRQAETGISRNFGGNGLGLALVKAYVELLNGTISLESEINKGSVFTVKIPIVEASHTPFDAKSVLKKNHVKTILIAEDEYSNYQLLYSLLEDLELTILHAENGQKALDMCRRDSKIDLILMDIKMPVMDGHTAATLIKDFRPEIPILAQTAYALESEKEDYIGVFDGYISKPITRETFFKNLSYYIDKL